MDVDDRNLVRAAGLVFSQVADPLAPQLQKDPERRKGCQDAQEEHHGQGVVPGIGIFAALFFSFFSILFRIKKEHSRLSFL